MPYTRVNFADNVTPMDQAHFNVMDAGVASLDTQMATKEDKSAKGQANGYASLDGSGKVLTSQLPAQTGTGIPGEVRMWSGATLPAAGYGKWVWADGAAYAAATYPNAAANIDAAWKTAFGVADPGAGQFRVPDLRGVNPTGLDQMPGGTRANRITRAVAISLAKNTGEEYHTIALGEVPAHGHGAGGLVVNSHSHGGGTGWQSADHAHIVPDHAHPATTSGSEAVDANTVAIGHGDHQWAGQYGIVGGSGAFWTGGVGTNHYHGVNAEAPGVGGTSANAGGGAAHENLPPSVFVPYIVCLS